MTKSLVSIMLLTVLPVIAQQQFQRGVYSLGGAIGYSSTSEETDFASMKRTSMIIDPELAYFLSPSFEITVGPRYNYTSFEVVNTGFPSPFNSSSTILGFGLGARYYYVTETVAPFVGIGGDVYWYKTTGASGGNAYSEPQKSYFGEFGVAVPVTPHFALVPAVQFMNLSIAGDTQTQTSVLVGFKYFVFE